MSQLNLPLSTNNITSAEITTSQLNFISNEYTVVGGEALRVDTTGKITGKITIDNIIVDGNKHGHKLQAKMHFEGGEIIVTSSCDVCNIDLDRKVIYKIPQRVMKQKCLSRMVKDICG